MDEPFQPQGLDNRILTSSNNMEKKKSKAALITSIILGVLLATALGLLAWLYMQNDAEKKKLNEEKAQLQSQLDILNAQEKDPVATEPEAETCKDTPTTAMKNNIKAALDSENTAVFSTYTSNPVKFVLAATEKGGDETPDQAAKDMEYTHSATGPWDFNLPAAALSAYDASFYTDYFDSNTYVGQSASGMVAAFDFDCNGKIKQIFIAAGSELLVN